MNDRVSRSELLYSGWPFKKTTRFFACFLAVAVLLLTGCGVHSVETGTDLSESNKYIFVHDPSGNTISAKSEGLRFCVDEGIFSEQSCSRAIDTIKKDIGEIELVFGPFSPVSVFVKKASAGECGALGNRVFCSFRDIENGCYRAPLVQACLELNEPWAAYGAAAYVFGEKPNNTELAEYYKTCADTDVLTLFAAYFCPEFAGDEKFNAARDTAASLSFFVIEKYGAEVFKKDVTSEQKREWLSALGTDRIFADPYDGKFEGYVYGSTKDCPLVVSANGISFYFRKIRDVIETPEQIRKLLTETSQGIENINEYLKLNAPRNYKNIKRNLYRQVSFYFVSGIHGGKMNGRTDAEQRRIDIADPAAILHEYIHIAVPRNSATGDIVWQYEGLAEYLSLKICPTEPVREKYYNVIFGNESRGTEPSDELTKLIREYYLKKAPYPKDPVETDPALFMEAVAVSTLLGPKIRTDSPLLSWTVLGNELTYPEAYLFVSYLIERYSLDTVLDYCHEGADFDAVFGNSYENIKIEWISSLSAG